MNQSDQDIGLQDVENIKSWIDLTNVLIDLNPDQAQQITKDIRAHLRSKGYIDPAPIQKMVLPYLLTDKTLERFCYIKSPTGTGKTLSFLFPLIFFFEDAYLQPFVQNINNEIQYQPYAIIMTGQHPLLRQIKDDLDDLIPQNLKQKGLKCEHLDKGDEKPSAQIICGVPEKIRTLITKGYISLQRLRYIIVDEADSVIIGDKQNHILAILKMLIRTDNLGWKMIVCGATIDKELLQNHIKKYMEGDEIIKNWPNFFQMKYFHQSIVLDNIFHYYYEPNQSKPDDMDNFLLSSIIDTLNEFDNAQIMVFFNGVMRCEEISRRLYENPQLQFLVKNNFICEIRSGLTIPRAEQQNIIEEFRNEKKKLMLCSDLMGRGMNFRKVRLVINYGVPRVYEKGPIDLRRYQQRVGRTGRMEDLGVAITIFDPDCYTLPVPEQKLLTSWKSDDNIKFNKYDKEDFCKQLEEVIEKTKHNK